MVNVPKVKLISFNKAIYFVDINSIRTDSPVGNFNYYMTTEIDK